MQLFNVIDQDDVVEYTYTYAFTTYLATVIHLTNNTAACMVFVHVVEVKSPFHCRKSVGNCTDEICCGRHQFKKYNQSQMRRSKLLQSNSFFSFQFHSVTHFFFFYGVSTAVRARSHGHGHKTRKVSEIDERIIYERNSTLLLPSKSRIVLRFSTFPLVFICTM